MLLEQNRNDWTKGTNKYKKVEGRNETKNSDTILSKWFDGKKMPGGCIFEYFTHGLM